MFKKRTIGLIGAALAGVALIGGTFAAWVVTDNADPFGINITPAGVDTDETPTVTLTYGTKSGFSDIDDLAKGVHRFVGSVGLRADSSNGEAYTGCFKMTLTDTTVNPQGETRLIDNVKVDAYLDANLTISQGSVTNYDSLTPLTTIAYGSSSYTASETVQVYDLQSQNYEDKVVYIVVTLKDDLNASALQALSNDSIYLEFDWNYSGADDEFVTKTIYLRGPEDAEAVYLYAWHNDIGETAFPGKPMTYLRDGYYSCELNTTTYTDLLFVIDDNQGRHQTSNLTLNVATPCYDYTHSTWEAAPNPQLETLTSNYFLVGTMNNWIRRENASYVFVNDTANNTDGATTQWKLTVTVSAGDKIKIRSKVNTEAWHGYSEAEADCKTGGSHAVVSNDSDNIVFDAAGTYDIYLKYYQNGNPQYKVWIAAA